MPDVVVIGGGITGVATADALAREGHAVALLEARRIAAMASGWTLGGVRQSGRDPAELPLARAAVALWAELGDTLGVDVEYRRNGNLRVARTPAEVDAIRALVASQRELGLDIDFLPNGGAVRTIAPALSPDILAASFCPSDGHANPIKTTHAFADSARRHGATIFEGVPARAIRISQNRVAGVETDGAFMPADRVIVAAGVNTAELLRPLGLDFPLSIEIVTVVQSEPLAPCLDPVFGVANADCAGRQEADGRLRFTGGLGPWGLDVARWTADTLAPSANDVRDVVAVVAHVLPVAGHAAIARTWRGLIDLTPDALPVIDAPESVAGLVVAVGFSGHGFCLGPISGSLCADLALARRPRLDLSAFRLGRFTERSIAAAELTLHG